MTPFEQIMNCESLYWESVYHARKGGKGAVIQWMKETFACTNTKAEVMDDVEKTWDMVKDVTR